MNKMKLSALCASMLLVASQSQAILALPAPVVVAAAPLFNASQAAFWAGHTCAVPAAATGLTSWFTAPLVGGVATLGSAAVAAKKGAFGWAKDKLPKQLQFASNLAPKTGVVATVKNGANGFVVDVKNKADQAWRLAQANPYKTGFGLAAVVATAYLAKRLYDASKRQKKVDLPRNFRRITRASRHGV